MRTLTIQADFSKIAPKVVQAIENGGASIEHISTLEKLVGGRHVHVYIFDKYYMRAKSATSLTVLLTEDGQTVEASLMGAGGGLGWMNLSWGTENNFERNAAEALCGIGFQ